MKFNDYRPKMKVDPERYVSSNPDIRRFDAHTWSFMLTSCLQTVEADGVLCEAEPSETLPLSQAYFLF